MYKVYIGSIRILTIINNFNSIISYVKFHVYQENYGILFRYKTLFLLIIKYH